jgi:hypothetical protein
MSRQVGGGSTVLGLKRGVHGAAIDAQPSAAAENSGAVGKKAKVEASAKGEMEGKKPSHTTAAETKKTIDKCECPCHTCACTCKRPLPEGARYHWPYDANGEFLPHQEWWAGN